MDKRKEIKDTSPVRNTTTNSPTCLNSFEWLNMWFLQTSYNIHLIWNYFSTKFLTSIRKEVYFDWTIPGPLKGKLLVGWIVAPPPVRVGLNRYSMS